MLRPLSKPFGNSVYDSYLEDDPSQRQSEESVEEVLILEMLRDVVAEAFLIIPLDVDGSFSDKTISFDVVSELLETSVMALFSGGESTL